MQISVVVPFHNSSRTLEACLAAIERASPPAREVILVDDASSDESPLIAARHAGRVVKNPARLGRGAAKNAGSRQVAGDLIVFVDSDVLIEPGTFGKLEALFAADSDLCGVSALPSIENPFPNFASQFKALYMHHVLARHSGYVSYAHGCVQAYRSAVFRDEGLRFDEKLHCDDVDMGLQLSARGRKLLLAASLSCVHLRFYSLLDLLRNDFFVPFEFAGLVFRYRALANSVRRGNFAHSSKAQVFAVLSAPLALACLLGAALWHSQALGAAALLLLAANLFLNGPFFGCLKRHKSLRWCVKASALNLVDQCCMTAGLTAGVLKALWQFRRS